VWRWFDESMLDCCESHDVIKLKGLTLSKVSCLARCNGATVSTKYATDISEDEFRRDVTLVCSETDEVNRKIMIVSYARPVLNQTGSGHFSPIGGFNQAADMVLIMDVARFKYPPHWVPLSLLYLAMREVDSESGRSRGYTLISKSESSVWSSCERSCDS
jgi:glutathione gamma-glutamylcysteinyltransferase